MTADSVKTYKLADYKISDYLMKHVDLELDLSQKPPKARARVSLVPNPKVIMPSSELKLDGEHMVLSSVMLNNQLVRPEDYLVTDTSLTLRNIPKNQDLIIETETLLGANTDLFGLYETEGIYLVKAETEGLRRVFYCNDRPDNLATYKTTIIASKKDYPVLLSNGKLLSHEQLENGLHKVIWEDLLPKPSYLFALVAGQLEQSISYFTKKSGAVIPIVFYIPAQAAPLCTFAQEVLQQSMAWDEDRCHLPCELNQHMVAGVNKYASGASEPTGLNLFNTENLYASLRTKTDLGILRVLEVVAHEYFHYWTGNRVTIRDWFNLPFKEGLTTFRAAQFRETLFGKTIVRLLDGKNLDERAPRQSTYTAVRSLYTAAAYEKSADIFRMMMRSVGESAFYPALTQFLKENDGGALTLEVLLESLTVKTGYDLNQYLPWFTESGIPKLLIEEDYDPKTQKYSLKTQIIEAKNRPIPLVLGLLNEEGQELVADTLLIVDKPEMIFYFDNLSSRPIPSLLRDDSAPVYLEYDISSEDLLILIQYDSNLYNRCEALKKLMIRWVQKYCREGQLNLPTSFFKTMRSLINDNSIEPWIQAELLSLISEEELICALKISDLSLLVDAMSWIKKAIAQELKPELQALALRLQEIKPHEYPQFDFFNIQDAGVRRLKAVYDTYAQYIDFEQTKTALVKQFNQALANNMTETLSALKLLCDMCPEDADTVLERFYHHWQSNPSVLNYWLKIQASIHSPQLVPRLKKLIHHEAFDLRNPNKVYALVGPFIINPYGFHQKSGAGYQFLAELIIILDKINPPLAANLTQNFAQKDRLDDKRHLMILENLTFIEAEAVSVDVLSRTKKLIAQMDTL